MLCDLGDVEQAVGAGEDLDECAELSQTNHLAEISFADLGHGGDVANHLDGAGQTVGVARSNVDATGVVHIDLDASGLDDAADDLAARSDEIANLVGRNLDGVNAGSELRLLFLGAGDGSVHGVEEVQTVLASLLKRLAHDLGSDAHDLDVHLERGDALAGAGDLEVHVAVVVFRTGDVGEDGVLVTLFDEAHGHACDRSLDGNTGLHERKRRAADGGHRRRTVRLQNVGDDAERVRALVFAGQDGLDRAPGKCAVADLAASDAGYASHGAHRERGKVVVQHEAAFLLAFVALHALRVVGGAEGRGDKGLGFATGEQGGAVDAGQNADLDRDLADLVEGAVIGTDALVQDLLAEDVSRSSS